MIKILKSHYKYLIVLGRRVGWEKRFFSQDTNKPLTCFKFVVVNCNICGHWSHYLKDLEKKIKKHKFFRHDMGLVAQ